MQTPLLSKTTRVLHSIMGLGMIGLIAVGLYMAETESYGLYGWHKSFGMLILLIAIPRIIWRIREGWPQPITAASQLQQGLARLVHWVLILSTVLFPVSGMMMSGGSGRGLYIFDFEVLAKTVDAATGKLIPVNETVAGVGHEIHEMLPPIIIAAIVVHVLGALKHQFIDKDGTLSRMFSMK